MNQFVDIRAMDPLQFLSELQKMRSPMAEIGSVPLGWVKKSHLLRLFEMLDSAEKCASVTCIGWSPSVHVGKRSTVGQEAGALITYFRTQKYYPPPLGSTLSKVDKEELRKWWQEYRKQKA